MKENQEPEPGRPPELLDAKASLALLGVRLQTLYAYVSRGAIRSVPQAGTRSHLYSRADIERVMARAAARAGHAAVAAGAMDLGSPIVSSGITDITDAGPSYRGHLASALAGQGVSFEEVCELLWGGALVLVDPSAWRVPASDEARVANASMELLRGADPSLLYGALAMLALRLGHPAEPEGGATCNADIARDARILLCAVVQAIGYVGPAQARTQPGDAEPLASVLLRAMGRRSTPDSVRAVNTLLVLLADHELPPGTLAVRAAASGGADLFDCMAVGICASAGTEIAGQYKDVQRFLSDHPSEAALRMRALQLRKAGRRIPGFTHPLYLHGDPRAKTLLDVASQQARGTSGIGTIRDFVQWAQDTLADYPRHEFAVVCVARALELPAWSGEVLFLVARIAGWAAHVQEQRGAIGLWRPRARYNAKPA